ncbi:MAG: polyphenol oxidase family protein, partial [Cyanobacteria bacterium P01_H01_bin.58]
MNHTWHWQTNTKHPYLQTSLLNQWHHGFFSRQSWPATPTTLTQVWRPDVPVYWAKQVHGNQVVDPSDFHQIVAESTEGQRPEADAVMTSAHDQGTWVCTADCTPMLIADAATGQVAAIHAGWRGTALGIGPKTIQKMQLQGSQLSDLRVAMGPAIAGEVYQVSTQVAVEVGKSL